MEIGKNNEANVLLYDDIQVIENIDVEDDNYKELSAIDNKLSITYRMIRYLSFEQQIQLTNILTDNRTSTIIGFIDPRTNKKYMRTDKDFYVGTNMIDHSYNKHRATELIWKNQTFSQIAVLIGKFEGFIDSNKLKCNLTSEDWKSYKYKNRRQAISRADNDYYLNHNDLDMGANNTYTADANKHYSDVGINRDMPFILQFF